MNILIHGNPNSQNSVIKNIAKGISESSPNANVTLSEDQFWSTEESYDVIHLHWPEALLNWKAASREELDRIEERLMHLKKQSAFVATMHNELPHRFRSEPLMKELYDFVYSNADAVIHLGEFSLTQSQRSNDQINSKIPHPLYPEYLNQEPAKSDGSDEILIFAPGRIRFDSEALFIYEGFKKISKESAKLLIGRLPGNQIPSWLPNPIPRLNYRKSAKRFYSDTSVKLLANDLSESDFKEKVKKADVIVIPRLDTLNSGILPLAFSAGKVCVGPSIGNIENILAETGNPIFHPGDYNSLTKALEIGIDLSNSDLPLKNLNFVKSEWSLSRIGELHLKLYKEVLDQRKIQA